MLLRRFFNPEPREKLGSGSGSLLFFVKRIPPQNFVFQRILNQHLKIRVLMKNLGEQIKRGKNALNTH
jgi:hypothetical protein